MANLYRVVVLLLALLGASGVQAFVCTQYRFVYDGTPTPWNTSSAGAAGDYASIAIPGENLKASTVPGTATHGNYAVWSAGGYPAVNGAGVTFATRLFSQYDGILAEVGVGSRTGDYCSASDCPAGTVYDSRTGMCVDQLTKTCADKKGFSTGYLDSVGPTPRDDTTVCDTNAGTTGDTAEGKGCSATVQKDIAVQQPDGQWITRYKGTYGGDKCLAATTPGGSATVPSGTETTKTTADKSVCPAGQEGFINGVKTCVPFDTNTPTQTEKTDVKTDTGSDGTITQTKTVTKNDCAAGNCTVTTVVTVTVTPPGGGTPTTTTSAGTPTTGSKDGFCASNPKAKECSGGVGSSFGGSCVQGFVCDGDAALCAVAKATNATNCLLDKDSAESALYKATVAAGTGTGIASSTVGISSSSFDSSNALGVGGACITDLTVTVMSKTIVLPLASICTHLATLGTLLLGLSWLIAISIVGRGIGV